MQLLEERDAELERLETVASGLREAAASRDLVAAEARRALSSKDSALRDKEARWVGPWAPGCDDGPGLLGLVQSVGLQRQREQHCYIAFTIQGAARAGSSVSCLMWPQELPRECAPHRLTVPACLPACLPACSFTGWRRWRTGKRR